MQEKRCQWADTVELIKYHDTEWGVPEHEDTKLFEMLILENMQAGLRWATILRKRKSLCEALDNFNPEIIAKYNENKIDELMKNEGIIRNRLKIKAVINNAKRFLEVQKIDGSFSAFLWKYTNHLPIINNWNDSNEVPGFTDLSQKISNDLKQLGFKFVGSTTVYSYMQSIGMVNDHINSCIKRTSI